jgi:hypothetical protein
MMEEGLQSGAWHERPQNRPAKTLVEGSSRNTLLVATWDRGSRYSLYFFLVQYKACTALFSHGGPWQKARDRGLIGFPR